MSAKNIFGKSIWVVALISLVGCADMTPQEQRVLSGAAIGTAVGAAGTVMTGGCVACGAAVGGVVGAGTGYVVDQMRKAGH